MRWRLLPSLLVFAILALHVPRAAAAVDWDPVSDAEKSMKANPLDPGAGAVVLFKRGQIDVIEKSSLFWTTRIQTYVRIKVFTDAGREAANVAVEHEKYVRLAKVEGHTILPSGDVIPLDSSKVFNGVKFQEGKHFAVLSTSFTLPSVEPGSIIEYQIDEYEDWFYPAPWIFDTGGYATLQSSLKVTIGPRLGMSNFPMDTTTNKLSVSQTDTVQGTELDYSVKNLRPIVTEPYSLPFRDQATMVLFTPTQLAFSGSVYPIITKWDDLGERFKHELDDMQKTDKETRNKAKELTDKISDPRMKAEAVYAFLQRNMISSNVIGVGLGRPVDELLNAKRADPDEINATYVLMLRDAKIDADLVLLATKNWETLARPFPNRSQFSRAITRINLKDGPVFADAADPAAPFGELPWYESGITGLAIKGSKIQEAAIPQGAADDNGSTTSSTMQISKDWTYEGDQEMRMKGAEAIEFRSDFMEEPPDKLQQRMTDFFAYGASDAEVSKVLHPEFQDASQPIVLKAHVKERLTNEIGQGGVLLNPWLGDAYVRPLFKTNVRHSAVRFHYPEKRVMTTTWQLAPEIKVEQLPKDVKIDSDLGGFAHSCTQSGNTVTCTRTYYLKAMALNTTADYLNAKKFFDDVAKQDQEAIVLRQ
jgi:hypothetical protein